MDNLGTLLAHNVWQSIIIFVVVFVILKLIKNTSAEEKSWSWSVTLFALALLPLSAFLPGEGLILEKSQAPVMTSFEETEAQSIQPVKNAPIKVKAKIKLESSSALSLPKIDKNDLLSAFLIIWSLGTSFALLRLIYAGFKAFRLRDDAYPYAGIADENWPQNVEIAVSEQINGPIVIGIFKPLILIPRGFAFGMDPNELKPLLYHELAHVKRRDNLLHFIERLIVAVYWWNPIMHYIAARIAEERELACDDRAASSCGDSLVYAKSLLKGARKLMGADKPVLGLAVLRRESVLSMRVKRMTVSSALEGLNVKRFLKNLSVLSMAILALCLITPRIAIGKDSINKSELNSVEMLRDGYFLEVEWKGTIELDDKEAEITEVSDGGYFSLVTEENGRRKELVMSNDGEAIESRFLVDGLEREMSAEDHAWQRYALLDMLRLSGSNAEQRVDRLYKQGGSEAVIDEISKMHSDYATRLYTEALVDIYDVEQDELQRLIVIIGDMESDYEKNLALETIANEQELDGETLELLASVALDNEQDFETLIEFEPISEQQREEIEREIKEQLEKLPSEEELERIQQEALQSIPSDEEIGRMREEALASLPTEAELEEMVAEALASVPSAEELEEINASALADFPSEEELSAMVKDALSDVPTVEELEEMTKAAGKFAPTMDELKAMREEALANVPSLEELKKLRLQALADLPTAEELEQIRQEALENIPDIEELRQMRNEAMEGLPTKEELQEMRNDIKENMLSKEDIEEITKELEEHLRDLPNNEELKQFELEIQESISEIQSDEIVMELHEHIQESVELDLVVEEMARVSTEIADNLSEIHIEFDELHIEQ